MKNIQYRYLDLNKVKSKTFNKLIPQCLNYDEADKLYNDRSKIRIGSADDGWSHIVYINGVYYRAQSGLQEYEGHVYMTPVELTDEKQLADANTIVFMNNPMSKERRMLISAIRGSSPSYDLFDAFTTLGLGSYVGGFTDTWKWNHADSFKDITIEELRLMWDDLDMCWEKYGLKE